MSDIEIWGFYVNNCSNKVLIAPKIEETLAKCMEKLVRSTDAPEWACLPARGGYVIHPVPAPASTIDDVSRSRKDGRSQKLILFIRGNAVSGVQLLMAPISKASDYDWYYHKENYYKCMGSDNYVVDLIVS